jgi:hypothetical protein
MSKTYKTETGQTLTDEDIERMADEIAQPDYDPGPMKRPVGRPPLENSLNEMLPIRLDSELRSAIEKRAKKEKTSSSELVREAVRKYLAS